MSRPFQIDRLLEVTCKRQAAELRLSSGQPPRIYLDGQFEKVSSRVLGTDDVIGLLRSITPDAVQARWRDTGDASFTFDFGDTAQFSVRVSGRQDDIEIVIRPVSSRPA